MTDLIMMVPSRGRPASIERLRDAWQATATGDTRLVVLVDDDDATLDEYQAIDLLDGMTLQVGPRLRIGGTLNAVAPQLATESFAIGFMGDDHVPRTPGWDIAFVEALRRLQTGVVYGNDLFQGPNLPTAVAMTSNIVTTLGYFVMPGGVHLFLDNFWMTIGNGINRLRYLDNVILEHLHPQLGKGDWDDTYVEANADATWSADEATFNAYVATTLPTDLEKLRRLP